MGDCDIDIIGFSRGAALARHFANEAKAKHPKINLRFIGLFDTVASFGLAGNNINLGYNLSLPSHYRGFQIRAMDERRMFFPFSSIMPEGYPGFDLGSDGYFTDSTGQEDIEIHMRGVHSDIGGGYDNHRAIANIALFRMWMAGKEAGVPFGPIPTKYQDYSQYKIHDSRWLNDHFRDVLFDPFNSHGGRLPFGLRGWPAVREVYYDR